MKALIDSFISSDKKRIFIIDAIGASLTAFFTAIVLGMNEKFFGMPQMVCISLSIVATIFAIYSVACFILLKHFRPQYLLVIILSNLIYLFVVLITIMKYLEQLSFLGIFYFASEIIVVGFVIWYEFQIIIFSKAQSALRK